MFDLPHVASRAFGTPLMIARAKLETILSVLGPRLAGTALSPIEPMADPTVHGVVLDVDSAGGEVGGLFDLVEQIGAMRAASGKPLWAVANESALSAAYAIASAADRVYVTRTGEIGSVGVVAVHVDESGADAKAGLAWTFVFAGERKVDGYAHAPLRVAIAET